MKLRIKGDSLRLRLSRSEVARLAEHGSVTETTHFAPGNTLGYAIEVGDGQAGLTARFENGGIAITAPAALVKTWAADDEVGLYGEAQTSSGSLIIAVEKDFACLDRDDAENADTFPNPKGKC